MSSSLVQTYRSLPRAARWGIVFLAFCGFYFGIVEPVMDRTRRAAERADRLESSLTQLAQLRSSDSEQGRDIGAGLDHFGEPLLPSQPAARPEEVYAAVNAVLDRHRIDDRTITERQSSIRDEDAQKIAGSALAVSGSGARVVRLILDVSFEASPETVAAVVADLERSPNITAISRVKLEKPGAGAGGSRAQARPASGGRVLKANIVPEAWVAAVAPPRSLPPNPASATTPADAGTAQQTPVPAPTPISDPHTPADTAPTTTPSP